MSELLDVVVGVVGRAHGVRGDVAVDLRTDEPDRRFADGTVLRVEDSTRTLTVEQAWWHSGRMLVHFAGVDDRTAVEALRGSVLVCDVPADETPDDPEEYYDRQLVGLEARRPSGGRVGVVREVIHTAAQDLLAIDADGREHLVPFVTALVPVVDLAGGWLTVADLPGLLDDEGEDADAAPERGRG